ncbi:fumarylacetoacetate hydrolase family protein [Fulvivirgaceae bacterium BMA12]|uniref:Fumarylacetoacetate hydrolase family protein n=1 Tax=Agaribacillus aureus TaxID=3051825 RepID=A0ABT8KYA3_9BACT|nr:fumarylacetoacetate hydrolase family protein [Fulvivirgaceae bacterium BMA12]
MQIFKVENLALIHHNGCYYIREAANWDTFINRTDLHQCLLDEIKYLKEFEDGASLLKGSIDAPIGSQEIWASGVTYYRSREARMEESKAAGGADFYDKVYEAERPELFFKALANRTVGSGGVVNIRKDSSWNVPEPELALFISDKGTIEGYTIGNDMSSRVIEGENPLYLPQAKVYDRCAGLGPCIYVPKDPISPDTSIHIAIRRNDVSVFEESIGISQMKRAHTELVAYLYRECNFEHGSFLMTGTGIIPPDDFTLKVKDEIRITIDPIGTLINFVGQK